METMTMNSPLGTLTLVATTAGLREIRFPGEAPVAAGNEEAATPVLEQTRRELEEYFAGSRREFQVPLDPEGTEFQRRVWALLARIPYGETITYGELARRTGNPSASRAVGSANGRNRIPIILPCHRVIGASGQLTGYAGGLRVKSFLLGLEGVCLPFNVAGGRQELG